MVLIQELATPLFKQIISWTNTILILLIIYKAIKLLITSFKGGKFKLPGSKNKQKNEEKPKDPTKDIIPETEKIKDEQEKVKDIFKKNGFNIDSMGKVRFYVHDVDGNPIMRTMVIAIPDLTGATKKEKKVLEKLLKDQTTNLTLPDGYTGQPIYLYEGYWHIIAFKYHFHPKEVFNKLKRKIIPGTKTRTSASPEVVFIKGGNEDNDGEEQIIEISLDRSTEDGFSPEIFKVQQVTDGSEQKLILEGIIR